MIRIKYLLFDVFAEEAFAGNQLAVFPECDGVNAATMQRIAKELNLAECIFLTRTGDEHVIASARIFTPACELPFAGHPTIGASIAIADVLQWIPRDRSAFVLREPVGEVSIRIDRGAETLAWLRTPPVTLGDRFTCEQAAAALSLSQNAVRTDIPVQIASAGSPLVFVPLVNPNAVDAAVIDERAASAITHGCVGIFLFAQTAQGTYARMFAPMSGIPEDPATGGATGPLYAYLFEHGAIPAQNERYVSTQGVKMGRRSVLHVEIHAADGRFESVEVGGRAIHVGQGELLF